MFDGRRRCELQRADAVHAIYTATDWRVYHDPSLCVSRSVDGCTLTAAVGWDELDVAGGGHRKLMLGVLAVVLQGAQPEVIGAIVLGRAVHVLHDGVGPAA